MSTHDVEKVSLESVEFGAICDAVSPLLRPLQYGALELDHAITPVIEQIISKRVAAAKAEALRDLSRELWARSSSTPVQGGA